jgi:subfamily B ATP-binding cassette protein MsbA
LTESLGGVRVVKGYHAEKREHDVFSAGVQRLIDNVLKTLTAMSFMSLGSSVMIGVVGGIIMFVGTRQIQTGALTLGGFFSYNIFLPFLIAPILQIVAIGTQITEALAGLERTREILNEKPEDELSSRKVSLDDIVGEVKFDNVEFAYEANKQVLHGVSFDSQPGTVTALVGSSGSGKSTIIGLIAAFHVPTRGRVLVDGVDLATVKLNSYRTRLGVVLQDSFLFDGTIRENVAFSRPDASTEQILEACRIARVDEFAESFKDGYNTIVGERGVKLSGGQRQRVAIARVFLKSPAVVVLDEATSSLDTESERLVEAALEELLEGRSTLIIAHRLSTVRRADRVVVLDHGRVIEEGTHAELLAHDGVYAKLYQGQFREDEIEV